MSQYILPLLLLHACFFTACSSSKSAKPSEPWYTSLPACPCENPDKNGLQLNDHWAKDKGNIDKYHHGATASYRSYPYTKTSVGKSGQQCCYDSAGKLITSGSGAGTPDKVSTCKGEDAQGMMKMRLFAIMGHLRRDVKPWEKDGGVNGGWKQYNLLWKPDNQNGCPDNMVPKQ